MIRFNGIDFSEFNTFWDGSQLFDKPEKDVTFISVLGRNGDLTISNDRYKNLQIKVNCFIRTNFEENFSNLINFLTSVDGYARFETSAEPNTYRMATYVRAIQPKTTSFNIGGFFTLVFDCKPQRFLYEGEVPVSVENINSTRTGTLISLEDTENTTSITDAKAELEPKVYHDYDSVWLAGYGKNKLRTTATEETVNGLTFKPNDGGTINVSGTSSEALTVSTDSEIYSKRVVENGYRLFDEIVGGSIVWNQFLSPKTGGSLNGITYTVSNGKYTFSGTATADATINLDASTPRFQANHVYILNGFSGGASNTYYFSLTGVSSSGYGFSFYANRIFKPTSGSSEHVRVTIKSGHTANFSIYPQITDLTSLFGNSTIADYIYQLEQSNSGNGVALFKKLFPLDYYAYNVGTIMSVCTSQHKMSNGNGFNAYTLSPLTLRGIPKLVNNKLVYDGDIYKSSGEVTRRYAEVDLGALDWGKTGTGLFWSDGVRGVIRPSEDTDRATGFMICPQYTEIGSSPISGPNGANPSPDKVFALNTAGRLFFNNLSYTDAASFKTAMSGVKLIYELATPTTESALPYTKPQICEQGGTEEYIDNEVTQGNRDVSIPVGHNTFYADYIVSNEAKITEGTYNLSNNLVVATRNGTTMKASSSSLTFAEGEKYEFSAYVGDTVGTFEPMISTVSEAYVPYVNNGFLEEYSSASLTISPKNIYPIPNGMLYQSGVFFNCLDGVVRTSGTATTNTYMMIGEPITVKGHFKVSGGIPTGDSKLILRKVTTVSGHSTVTDIEINNTDYSLYISGIGTTTLQFKIEVAEGQGDGLVFKPMIRFADIEDSTFEEGSGEMKQILSDFGSVAYGGNYDFTTGILTETHRAVDLSSLTWTVNVLEGNYWLCQSTLPATADVTANINQHFCTGMPVEYGISSNAKVGVLTIYKSGNAQSSVIYMKLLKQDAHASVIAELLSEVYLCYKLATPVETSLTANEVKLITNIKNYIYSMYQPSDLSAMYDFHSLTIVSSMPTVIENPTGMKAYPLIQIVPTDDTDGYVRINGATIFVKMNGVLNHGVYFFDTEIQDAYYGDYENANSWVYTLDSSIFFKEGKNVVTFENVDRVVIYPRWWKL